jgi:methyl coenzyme M reductase subunit C-like uncharacterized protein (methanogenesis marker protein 7)
MDKERLKLIVKNIESLVNCLKEELQLDENKQKLNYDEIAQYIDDCEIRNSPPVNDYDEIFSEDD